MLGNKIKQYRNKKGWTQAQFAELLNQRFGLKTERSMVSKWESGTQQPMIYTLTCIAKLFDIPLDFLTDDNPHQIKKGKKIPVLGSVPAGIPIEAVEDIIDYEEITDEMARAGDYFGLRIRGNSMEPKISDGDVVIVRKQETVENGQIAVVMINGDDATVKKFYKTDAGIMLVGLNPSFSPLTYTPEQAEQLPVRVIGRVVELRAKF